jgi:hypothetical protein
MPRTGHKNPDGSEDRVILPTYMRDVFAYAAHPGQTLVNKAHPLITTIAELYRNKDFYNREIVNHDDPLTKQAQQTATFLAGQYMPFSFRIAARQAQQGEGIGIQAQTFFGIVPASREYVRTPAMNKIAEFIQDRRPSGAQTPEQVEAQDVRRALMQDARAGKLLGSALRSAAKDAGLTKRQRENLVRNAKLDPRVVSFKVLTPDEAEKVYALASPEEKQLWEKWLLRKRRNAKANQ